MSEPTEDNGYSIYPLGRDGERGERIAQNLTALEALAFLSWGTGSDPEALERYQVVRQSDDKTMDAPQFLAQAQQQPSPAVREVATAWYRLEKYRGGQAAIRQSWPSLAEALDKLTAEVSGA